MSILALPFNNKNQYRKYPLKQDTTGCSDDGFILPDNFIVNCSISTTYGKHRIYIAQVYALGNFLRVTIANVADGEALGVFAGTVTKDFTTLQLTSFDVHTTGSLTIGSADVLRTIYRTRYFSPALTELEESTIFVYTPPAVSSIRDARNSTLTGTVKLGVLTNVSRVTDQTGVQLKASNPSAIFNQADKSSYLGNCPTPVIKNINGITPYPVGVANAANDGNIYLVGVKPIVFYGIPTVAGIEEGALAISTGSMTLDSLCTQRHKLLPPVHVEGFTLSTDEFKNKYYNKSSLPHYPAGGDNYPLERPARAASNFNAVQVPEYYFWPQFVQPEYYNFWPTQ